MRLANAMATVGGLTLLSRIFGFIRDAMTAVTLGAGPLADAFFVALKLPNLFRRISAEGAFTVAFIPLFSESIEKDGDKESLNMARNIMGFMFLILSAFALIAILAMPYIMFAIAPGFGVDDIRYQTSIDLTRITFAYIVFISMASLLGGVMNTIGKFSVYAFLPSLFNLTLILFIYLNDYIWHEPSTALAWGVLAAGIVQFLWIFVTAARHGWLVYPTFPKMTPKLKRLLVLMLPGILGAGVYHINIFADMMIASFLESGSISYLYYADRLQQLPLGVVGIAIGTALLPLLSRSLVAQKFDEANNYFNRAIEACMLFALPAAVALMLVAQPIILSLFNYGAFSLKDSITTSYVLTAYALGLPVYIISKVFQSACFARQDTKSPVKISIICAIINIIFGIILSRYIGVAGIALSTSISGIVQIIMLYKIMTKIEHLSFDSRLKKNGIKIIVACLIMGLVIAAIQYGLGDVFMTEDKIRIIALGAMLGCGGGVYLACIFGFKTFTKDEILSFFKKGQNNT